ncbi:hypothetical protein QBZ16_001180 [Prototheca wickerhamii]|uniref:AAA+ ATPase domain-containing protein n=1 Tax=Prototheca wickerhamii TaxID=3111 RepID=A0AAD9MKF2_PROWI|nr:hypothetical protein QBZ16_001180 [Prototheca wickerhamii]
MGYSALLNSGRGLAQSASMVGTEELDDDELLRLAVEQLPDESQLPIGGSSQRRAGGLSTVQTLESQPDFDEEAAQLLAEDGEEDGSNPGDEGTDDASDSDDPLEPYVPPSRSVLDIPGACLPVTGADGCRVYCQLRDSSAAAPAPADRPRRHKQLLSRPISALMEEPSKKKPRRLWVDRHAPRSFMDLLSSEVVNREVVRWLKGWDPCVFGRPPVPGAEAPDELGRPSQRIVLLTGPPGMGKSTLARIAATHCGYRPLEVNASDERGAAGLAARVAAATASHSVTADRRPVCLILDEIDGALGGPEGKGAIAALLRIVQAAPRAKSGHGAAAPAAPAAKDVADDASDSDDAEEDDARKPTKNPPLSRPGKAARSADRSSGPLLRPIIAICNDLYAPALRPLRDVARIFHFRKPTSERIAQKLSQICVAEGLHAEKSTLRTLAEMAECDVRCCLNTLQFMSRKKECVCLEDLRGLSLGKKDVNRSAFDIWQDLLFTRTPTGRAGERPQARTMRLFSLLQDYGEHELVAGGLFENLPGLHFYDMACARTAKAAEALAEADVFLRGGGGWVLPSLVITAAGHVASHERQVKERDVLPALEFAVVPRVRPVHHSVYTPEESAALQRAVGALHAFGLRPVAAQEDRPFGRGPGAMHPEPAVRGLPAGASGPPLHFLPPVHTLGRFSDEGQSAPKHVPVPLTLAERLQKTTANKDTLAAATRKSYGGQQYGGGGYNGGYPPQQQQQGYGAGYPPPNYQQGGYGGPPPGYPGSGPPAQLPAAARAGVRAEHHITAGHGRVLRCLVSAGLAALCCCCLMDAIF